MPKSIRKRRYQRKSAPRPSSTDTDQAFDRVETISRNARGLWFGLLAALVFSGITLLRVEDIDFFGVDRATQLPLVGVSVPVVAFFGAGGALTTAIYVYFHLYLVQLYEALGETAPTHRGQPLSKAVYPWMITDTLIRWRSGLRETDGSAAPRTLAQLSAAASIAAVWLFGLLVIGYFWWRSMPAHDEWLTMLLGGLFTLALWVAITTAFAAREYLAGRHHTHPLWRRLRMPFVAALLIAIVPISWVRTEGGLEGYIEDTRWKTEAIEKYLGIEAHLLNSILARADLKAKKFTAFPTDWQNYHLAKKWFRQEWCQREGLKPPCLDISLQKQTEFHQDWWEDRLTYIDGLSKPKLSNRDFRNAMMANSFLVGVDLENSRLEETDLGNSHLEGANLLRAQLHHARWSKSKIENGDFRGAVLYKTNLTNSSLAGVDFRGAFLEHTELPYANMDGADFTGAKMFYTDLSYASLKGALIARDTLQSPVSGEIQTWDHTSFDWSNSDALALKGIDLTKATGIDQKWLDRTFGDSTVIFNTGTQNYHPVERPCHWSSKNLKMDTQSPKDGFMAHWRGWVEANGMTWPTSKQFDGWKDITPIPPPPDCPLIKDMAKN